MDYTLGKVNFYDRGHDYYIKILLSNNTDIRGNYSKNYLPKIELGTLLFTNEKFSTKRSLLYVYYIENNICISTSEAKSSQELETIYNKIKKLKLFL